MWQPDDARNVHSPGTSFSAAHADVIARYLQKYPNRSRDQIVTDLNAYNATYSGKQIADGHGNSRPVLVYYQCP